MEYILTSPLEFTETQTAPKDVFTAPNGIHFEIVVVVTTKPLIDLAKAQDKT